MVAASGPADVETILKRMRTALSNATRDRLYGELSVTVRFEDGVACAEKISVTSTRKLRD
jgi:hypothetical protein